jgi:ankyrin repeat protein
MGKVDTMKTLKRLGASINAVCNSGSNAAHHAARNKQLDGLEVFKEIGGDIQIVNTDGFTPLGIAIEFNQASVVSKLVALGVDPNIANDEGFTAVHFCAYYNRADLFALLLESHDCDMLAENKHKETAGHVAAYYNKVPALEKFIDLCVAEDATFAETAQACTLAHCAAFNGSVGALKVLAGKEVTLKGTDGEGWSPLHRAAHGNKDEAIHYLLEHELDELKAQDEWAVMQAVRHETLVLHRKDHHGDTAGQLAQIVSSNSAYLMLMQVV